METVWLQHILRKLFLANIFRGEVKRIRPEIKFGRISKNMFSHIFMAYIYIDDTVQRIKVLYG